jgi:hypothetical protein
MDTLSDFVQRGQRAQAEVDKLCTRDPQSPDEWQEAVDLAKFHLLLDSAVQYGLVTGPRANVERCLDILRRGGNLGYNPPRREVLVERYIGKAKP